MSDLYLEHHGIKGMKWGVRRYQNPDGSLTAAGKNRYLKTSSKNLQRTLKKAVRKQRGELHGGSNRWMSGTPIGPNSEKLQNDIKAKRDAYHNSSEYKEWEKKYDSFEKRQEKLYGTDKFDQEYYDKKHKELWNARPKKNFNDTHEWVYIVGKGYTDDFAKKGGYDLTMAYLKDLGFNNKTAKQLADRMLKKNYTLGGI